VFKLGIAIIKISNGSNSKLYYFFDGNFWPIPGSSPDLFDAHRCLLTTGSDARAMNSKVDVLFAGNN
jgi:hypothetical protein